MIIGDRGKIYIVNGVDLFPFWMDNKRVKIMKLCFIM